MHNFRLAKDKIVPNEENEELQRTRGIEEASLSTRHPEETPYNREQNDKYAVRYAGGGRGMGVIGNAGKSGKDKKDSSKKETSVASSLSEKKYPTSPTNRPQFVVGTLSPQDSQKFTTEIEGRVMKKISNTVFGGDDKEVGMNYPVKLPEARYQLIELHAILDEMINETRYGQQVLLGSNATFEATAKICLFNTTGGSAAPSGVGGLNSSGSLGGASQGGSTGSMPSIDKFRDSKGPLAGGIPGSITIGKSIPVQPSGIRSPVAPGSNPRDTYTHPINDRNVIRDGSRIDSINQSVKSNTVRQIYSNITSHGTSSVRPLDSSVGGIEKKAEKFSYDMILAQLTNQAVVKASRLHKFYRKHLIAIEREYHDEMEKMRKTTETCKTRLQAYEAKERSSQKRVAALLQGTVHHDERHFESDIVLPEITEYLAKIQNPGSAAATGGADAGGGNDVAEMLAHQLQEERHNNSRYIEELTEEVDALQKKFSIAVHANQRMQEELEDKELEVEDLKDRMQRQKEIAEGEKNVLNVTIAAHLKQKNVYSEAPVRHRVSSFDREDDDSGVGRNRGEESFRGDRRQNTRDGGRGGGDVASRRASSSSNSPMISRQGSNQDMVDGQERGNRRRSSKR